MAGAASGSEKVDLDGQGNAKTSIPEHSVAEFHAEGKTFHEIDAGTSRYEFHGS